MEGVDVLEDRALAEQHQIGVAARPDRRIRSQRAVLREVLAGGLELGLIARPLLGAAPPPGRVERKERELDERAAGHETKVRVCPVAIVPRGTTVRTEKLEGNQDLPIGKVKMV